MSTKARAQALEAMIEAHALELKLPTLRRRFRALAAEALREQQTHVAYLAALLEAEMAERAERRERRRLIDARFPVTKRLEDFRYEDNPAVSPTVIAALAEGGWIEDRESVILVGDSGTGKTHCENGFSGPGRSLPGCTGGPGMTPKTHWPQVAGPLKGPAPRVPLPWICLPGSAVPAWPSAQVA